ncbi:unnamed protein product [Linum tenue]|uniref:Uncharacterized protein n=1 Tax=Linum tenue TaxID=586396 RepID=A0AAV0PVQ6_9ROSI|nr:unnamed protein product [Linum tenue]
MDPPPPPSPFLLLLFFFLLLLSPATATPAFSFPSSYTSYKTAVSLSNSLLSRVSNLRAARGDVSGANRARLMAEKLERGLESGVWGFAWSVGWDYVSNYAWRELEYRELLGAISDLNDLISVLGGLTSARSDAERVAWAAQNYGNLAKTAKSALRRMLNTFNKKGALKEALETVQKEVVQGGLLRDCVEVGSNDLRGLMEILKDWASRLYFSPGDAGDWEL